MFHEETVKVDFLIIGAGVVGCALASQLSKKYKNKSIIIVEQGPRIAEGVTSRNSGVIHAGIYYPPHSLKASTCIEGKNLLYSWVNKKNIPYKKLGKLILARSSEEKTQLEQLYMNALESGATGLEKISGTKIIELEPDLDGFSEALYSKETGIIDPFELTKSFLDEALQYDVLLLPNTKVTAIELSAKNQAVATTRGNIQCDIIFNCAGLYADEIAHMAGIQKYKIYPVKGSYFNFKTAKKFNHLIYPVKNPKDTGLGVHLTIDLSGKYRLGPDAHYVDSKNDFTSAENKMDEFKKSAQKLFGTHEFEITYDTCGIRPKLRGPEDRLEKDFVLSRDHWGMVNFVGIESPGLTASMALAQKALQLL